MTFAQKVDVVAGEPGCAATIRVGLEQRLANLDQCTLLNGLSSDVTCFGSVDFCVGEIELCLVH